MVTQGFIMLQSVFRIPCRKIIALQIYFFIFLTYQQNSKSQLIHQIMKVSTRNTLKGMVKKIEHGAVNSEIIIELPGGLEIVSIITKSSAEKLDLHVGKEVYGLIKASNVMIAVDD